MQCKTEVLTGWSLILTRAVSAAQLDHAQQSQEGNYINNLSGLDSMVVGMCCRVNFVKKLT